MSISIDYKEDFTLLIAEQIGRNENMEISASDFVGDYLKQILSLEIKRLVELKRNQEKELAVQVIVEQEETVKQSKLSEDTETINKGIIYVR